MPTTSPFSSLRQIHQSIEQDRPVLMRYLTEDGSSLPPSVQAKFSVNPLLSRRFGEEVAKRATDKLGSDAMFENAGAKLMGVLNRYSPGSLGGNAFYDLIGTIVARDIAEYEDTPEAAVFLADDLMDKFYIFSPDVDTDDIVDCISNDE